MEFELGENDVLGEILDAFLDASCKCGRSHEDINFLKVQAVDADGRGLGEVIIVRRDLGYWARTARRAAGLPKEG